MEKEYKLSEIELSVLYRIIGDDQLSSEKIHPILKDLSNRGYIKILPAKTIFGGVTGEFLFHLTEACKNYLYLLNLCGGANSGE